MAAILHLRDELRVVRVAHQRRVARRIEPRRQHSRHLAEADLRVTSRQVGEQLPGLGLVLRRFHDRQIGAREESLVAFEAGRVRCDAEVRCGHRLELAALGLRRAHLLQDPRAGEDNGVLAVEEAGLDLSRVLFERAARHQPFGGEARVVDDGLHRLGRIDRRALAIGAEHVASGVPDPRRQVVHDVPVVLAGVTQGRDLLAADLGAVDLLHRLLEAAPIGERVARLDAGFLEHVGAIERGARVGVPGNREHLGVVEAVRRSPHHREERLCAAGFVLLLLAQRLERAHRRDRRDPGRPELEHVGSLARGCRGGDLGPGRFPVEHGHIDAQGRVARDERAQQFTHVLLLLLGGRHDPQVQLGRARAGGRGEQTRTEQAGGECSSGPCVHRQSLSRRHALADFRRCALASQVRVLPRALGRFTAASGYIS